MNIIYILGVFLLLGGVRSQEEAEEEAAPTLPPTQLITFDEMEPGSGGGEGREECSMYVITYTKMYLRGVKEPNHISYNATTLEGCEEKCCYEKRFECKSFSYFEPTKQCFVMNVTRRDNPKYNLIDSSGHTHAERYVISTIAATTEFPTPALTAKSKPTNEPKTGDKDPAGKGPNKGKISPGDTSDKLVSSSASCTKRCNRGICRLRSTNSKIASKEQFCECEKGFFGDRCEDEVSQAGGFPAWLIALIVVGGIILILFLSICIVYHVYRKKTGEYKVVKQIQKWTRRGKKKHRAPGSPEDFMNAEEALHHHTSPTTSVLSIHGSVTSSTTHSTTTSV